MSRAFRLFFLSLLYSYVSASSSGVIDYCKSVGGKKVAVCATFGSDSSKIYDEVISSQDSAVAFQYSTPADLIKIGGSDITVGFIKAIHLKGDTSTLIAQLQALIETTIANRKSSKLILVLSEDTGRSAEAKVTSLLKEAWSLLPKSLISGKIVLSDVIHYSFVKTRSDDNSELKAAVRAALDQKLQNTDYLLSGSQIISTSQQPSKPSKTQTDDHLEAVASVTAQAVADSLLKDITSKLATLSSSPSIADLQVVIADSLAKNADLFPRAFEDYAATRALSVASTRARASLVALLQPVYRRMADSIRASAIRTFDAMILRVPPNSRLVGGLRAHAATAQETFILKTDELRAAFAEIVSGLGSLNLLAGGPWSKKSSSVSSLSSGIWNTGAELHALRTHLAEACADRERQLFLQGAFNPFVRDKPIPPTRLSFHYLVDPRTVWFNRDYNPLYDAQKDGLATDRAFPLIVPAVAGMPFDPNEHAVPKDDKPWWQTLIDFYKNDM